MPQRTKSLAPIPFLAALAAVAQSTPDLTPPGPKRLDTVIITAEDAVMPTYRTLNSVFGDDRSILDTPRSVSLITKAELIERNIDLMTDIGQLSAGTYTPQRYGLPGVPLIRGDFAEVYQNGQRGLFSRDSILPSFNQVEAIDVVKGPGSAVYGPQGQGPGGYVNFITKQPLFDGFHGELTARLGDYIPGGASYWNPEVTLDFGGPISKVFAYRISYLDREADSYYQNVKNRTHDLFAAFTWRPTPDWQFDWTIQYIDSRFNEIDGINRVTQELLDHWIYNAGPVQSVNTYWLPINGFGPYGPNSYNLLLNTNLTYKVKIYGYQSLTSPQDNAVGERINSQLISTYHINDSTSVVNLSYVEYLNSSKYESFGYTEFVPENWEVDNRTELHYDFDLRALNQNILFKTISGLDFKYFRLKSYQDFNTEPFFLYDLTQPAGTFSIPGIPPGSSIAGGYNVPNHPGYGDSTFSAGNQDTDYYQTALFSQWDINPVRDLDFIAGGRADYFAVKTQSPDFYDYSGVYNPPGSVFNARTYRIDTSVFISGIYKWTPTISSYVTYDLVDSVAGSVNFGGVNALPQAATPAPVQAALTSLQSLKQSLTIPSELIEVGQKGSFFDKTLYLSVAAFQQTKETPQIAGPPNDTVVRGVEVETVYQPDRSFNVTANMTLQDGYYKNVWQYLQTGSYLDAYPTGFIQDGRPGTGIGSPNSTSIYFSQVHLAAFPHVLINAYATYQFPCGFGLSIGPQIEGSQNATYAPAASQLKIQAQYTLNAAIFFKQPRWEVRVNIDNLTDERNWTAVDPDYAGAEIIFPELPIHITGLIKYKF